MQQATLPGTISMNKEDTTAVEVKMTPQQKSAEIDDAWRAYAQSPQGRKRQEELSRVSAQ